MKTTLRPLAELILKNVDILEADFEARGVDVPSLDELFSPVDDFKRDDPKVHTAVTVLVAAAQQLVQTVSPPHKNLGSANNGCVTAAAIRCAAEFFIADILAEAGPAGLHVNEIATKCRTDPLKLGAVLRCLAGNWVFREVKPDVFANNRNSSMLLKGLSFSELRDNPEIKYSKPEGAVSAMLCSASEDVAKLACNLYESLSDPATAFSDEPTEAAFNRAFQTNMPLWEFFEQPDQKRRLHRFGVAMEGWRKLDPPELAIQGFDWDALPNGSVVVDVGGGIGTLSLALAKAHPRLKVVCQDRPPVADEGTKRWQQNELVSSSRVTFQGHNFFDPQPIKDAAVFMLRFILHDWADSYALKVLLQLRAAAHAETHLLVLEKIMPHTCRLSGHVAADNVGIPGVLSPEMPEPISNMSAGNIIPHVSSLNMSMWANGMERTLGHFVRLLAKGGWKVVRVHQFEALGELSSQITAVPV